MPFSRIPVATLMISFPTPDKLSSSSFFFVPLGVTALAPVVADAVVSNGASVVGSGPLYHSQASRLLTQRTRTSSWILNMLLPRATVLQSVSVCSSSSSTQCSHCSSKVPPVCQPVNS